MGLKMVMAALLCAGALHASEAVLMVDGAKEAFQPERVQAQTAIHLKQIGAEKVYALTFGEQVRDLNLSANALPILPNGFVPKTIQRLWLADNILMELPAEVATWSSMTYLNLDRNRLVALPDLSQTALRWLRLNDNRLTALPPLPESLETLQVQRNQLTTFTQRPAALRQLNLSGNPLTSIPEEVGNGLEWLDLSKTKVTALPANLKGWRSLKVLNLAECPLPEAEKDRIEAAFNPLHTTILF